MLSVSIGFISTSNEHVQDLYGMKREDVRERLALESPKKLEYWLRYEQNGEVG